METQEDLGATASKRRLWPPQKGTKLQGVAPEISLGPQDCRIVLAKPTRHGFGEKHSRAPKPAIAAELKQLCCKDVVTMTTEDNRLMR
jgi:hypothetical protein